MSFLQPWLLAALPCVALPIVIHLVNQRRYQTMPWGAMHFLLAANRMSRGYARIRQWLILALRVLVVAALIVGISRPLASGWLGLAAGGRVDATLLLLDRSPSMATRASPDAPSKLESAKAQLVETWETLPTSRLLMIDQAEETPVELPTPRDLLTSPQATGLSSSADLPSMLQRAHQYLVTQQLARCDIWIGSDMSRTDWDPESGRWSALRDAYRALPPGTRIHVLAYDQREPANWAIRVTRVEQQDRPTGSELLVSLVVERGQDVAHTTIPLRWEFEGGNSSFDLEVTGARTELRDYRIPLQGTNRSGWGSVSIPADANESNNRSWFVYSPPPLPATVLVADDPARVQAITLAAGIAVDGQTTPRAEVMGPDQVGRIAWEEIGLVVWQSALPEGETLQQLEAFVRAGGTLICLPPSVPTARQSLGLQWREWQTAPQPWTVTTWRGDADLLANTQSGAALPVGGLQVARYCPFTGESTPLARLSNGEPLLARLPSDGGAIYVCTTTPDARDSSLARDGVTLYVALQRALNQGSTRLAAARNLEAGQPGMPAMNEWRPVTGAVGALSSQYAHHAGIYRNDKQWLALNRPASEDRQETVSDAELNQLLEGIDFVKIGERTGSVTSLVHEVWQLLLMAMLAALGLEALLSLPRRLSPAQETP